MSQFVHLHNHSHFSLLDAACKIDDLVHAAKEQNMPAVALTDHGVMSGAIEFYKKAKKAEVKPIIGMEAYIVTRGSRFEKSLVLTDSGSKRSNYHHLVLLAKNAAGYKNLLKLTSRGHTEGYYYKPRIDTELLREHREGLIALSACLSGVVSSPLASGKEKEAYENGEIYKSIFGDDFYIEIQNHGLEKEAIVRSKAPQLAKDLGLKLVATNDVHYLRHEHAIPHNIMLLIPDASSSNPQDYTKLRYQTDQAYFKSTKEMVTLFSDFPEAILSTVEIAEKCDLKLDLRQNHMPDFPIPPDAGVGSLDEYLEKLAREGFARRYPEPGDEARRRLEHELGVIKSMGYAGYFLIVHDFIKAAREMDVFVGPGRGSAAGSIVSYCLGITNVDPLKYDLLFERFLNPQRVSMPDIDIDFSDKKREKVIDYVRQKYGDESVSQIITFGTLSSKAVLKDVGRVLGIPLSTIDSINKTIPSEFGKVRPLAEALKTIPELKWVNESTDPKIKMLVDASLVLEGMNRNAGMHAAGVVIAPGDISDYVPLYKTPQTEVMTQYNMKDLEEAGLLKMDFLGLRTLSVIESALRMIEENHGVRIDLDAIPEDDPSTFELFSRGDTVGVFQFESSGMQESLRKLKPTTISDLVAMNALYRPGPMEMIEDFINRKHGREKISYLHPALETILKETYGVIVYQEQVMKIASEVAGFSLAKADLMRRAMGKKDDALMASVKDEFIKGSIERGSDRKLAADIFDLIQKFAKYGFNKSHSVAYSVVAYQTAYLKAHYAAEFMAATLSSELNDIDRIAVLIDACRKSGIPLLGPDVNESALDFTVKDKTIRFGLCAIKNVGESAVEGVVKARTERGAFLNIFDFCARADLRLVNKKCLESLVQAGAFDALGGHRSQHFEIIEAATAYGLRRQSQELSGQTGLFDITETPKGMTVVHPPLPETPRWSEFEKLQHEKNVLGFYVSGHPLLKYEHEVKEFSTVPLGDPSALKPGSIIRACGIVNSVKRKIDKRNNTMAFVSIEDFTGTAECIVFSDAFQKYQHELVQDAIVMVVGKGEVNGPSLKVLVNEVFPIEKVRERFTKSIMVSIDLKSVKEENIVELRRIFESNQGRTPCYLKVKEARTTRVYQTTRFLVDPSEQLVQGVQAVLGPNSIAFSSGI
ncbi:MAG: DNA polymerase III subunit alpha [Bacteroidota bacterium]